MSLTDSSLADSFDAPAPMLCVSIHDVAPATWSDCLRLVQAVREVADIPLTWLVVPHYHFRPERSPAMEACLEVVVERGDELALHGYSHLDTETAGGGLRGRFLRNVYTRREGEFAALDEAEARRRLDLGLAWFAERGWKPAGFIPPAWLLGKGAWRALRASGFAYTTTFSHFHCLGGSGEAGAAGGRAVLSPSLVYAARNRGGRLLSPRVADATAAMLANAPLVRFSLHPPDARYPELVRHTQRMLERLLAQREAVTKAECARRLMLAQARQQLPADAHAQAEAGVRADAGKLVLPIMGAAPVRSAGADEPLAPDETENKIGDQAEAGNEAVEAADGKAAGEYAAYGDDTSIADTATLPDVATPVAAPVAAPAAPAAAPVTVPAALVAAPVDVSEAAPVAEPAAVPVAEPAAAPMTAAVSAPAVDTAPQAAPGTEEIVTEAVSAPASPPGATSSAQALSADFRSPHRVVPSFARLPDGAADATSASPTSRRPSGRSRSRHSSASRNAATRPSH